MTIKAKWDSLETWKKRLGTIAGLLTAMLAIAGPIWAGSRLLATDAEVVAQLNVHKTSIDLQIAAVDNRFEAYTVRQEEKEKQRIIRDARDQLEDVEYRLLDPQLPDVQRAALTQKKNKLLRRIACIQAEKAFCQ